MSVCLKVAKQADRQTGGKTGRHTDIEKGRQAEGHREREDKWTDGQWDRGRNRQ
jgi:hypothetical protein